MDKEVSDIDEITPDYFEVVNYDDYERDTINNIKTAINNLINLEKTNSNHVSSVECHFLFGDLNITITKRNKEDKVSIWNYIRDKLGL